MSKMKKNRKYRSKITSKSSWNKRMSCRQNMHKGRIKAEHKRRNKNYTPNNRDGSVFAVTICLFLVFSFIGKTFEFIEERQYEKEVKQRQKEEIEEKILMIEESYESIFGENWREIMKYDEKEERIEYYKETFGEDWKEEMGYKWYERYYNNNNYYYNKSNNDTPF